MSTLPLTGGRKKAERKPRTEGVVKLEGRRHYYARLYKPGSKRATYRCTYMATTVRAEEVLPHLRALVLRGETTTAMGVLQRELPFGGGRR